MYRVSVKGGAHVDSGMNQSLERRLYTGEGTTAFARICGVYNPVSGKKRKYSGMIHFYLL